MTTLPREMRLTQPGESSNPLTRHFPAVNGGTCEHCGTIDKNYPGEVQYKFCPHYKGMNLKCVYCPANKDHEEVVRNSRMKIMEHPHRPGQLVTLCGSFECNKRFEEEFNIRR